MKFIKTIVFLVISILLIAGTYFLELRAEAGDAEELKEMGDFASVNYDSDTLVPEGEDEEDNIELKVVLETIRLMNIFLNLNLDRFGEILPLVIQG